MLAALGLALAPLPARAADEGQAKLEELRQAIEESRERVTGFERRERELLELMEEIDRRLDALRAEVDAARRRADAARAELARVEERRARLESQLARTRRAMSVRAVALYKAGEVGPVRAVFSATSLRDLLSRVSTLRTLLEHDADLVSRFRRERDALAGAEREARQAADELDEALAGLRAQSDALAHERRVKRQVLARVHEDRTRERALLNELETAARALEETLAGLGESKPSALVPGLGDFEARRGALPSPVDAPVARGYGRVVDTQFLTATFRKGVEFDAPAGEPVHAVAPGEVRYAGWFRGYGKIVIIDHGDRWFTVSGHLDDVSVEVGDPVSDGEVIGSVGETGSLTGPKLYFEIRRGSQAQDPADWLEAGGRR